MKQPTPAPFALVLLALCAIYFVWLYFRERASGSGNGKRQKEKYLKLLHSEIAQLQSKELPDCEEGIMTMMEDMIGNEDFSEWNDHTNYYEIVLANLYHVCYMALLSHKFHKEIGTLTPEGGQLLQITISSLKKANYFNFISDREMESKVNDVIRNVLEN